jgi:hypothetical protein
VQDWALSTHIGRSCCGNERPLCRGELPATSERFRRTTATRSTAGQRSVVWTGKRPSADVAPADLTAAKRLFNVHQCGAARTSIWFAATERPPEQGTVVVALSAASHRWTLATCTTTRAMTTNCGTSAPAAPSERPGQALAVWPVPRSQPGQCQRTQAGVTPAAAGTSTGLHPPRAP